MWAALVTCDASANGRFPASNLVVFDPNDADHLIVRTTFGHLESRDAGQSFDFVCESALRLGAEQDPMLAFTRTGPLVIATFGGLLASDDGCSFGYVPGFEGDVIPDLAACAGAPDTLVAFRLLGLGGGFYRGTLLRTDDGARSFRHLSDLPSELLPLTVDLAARDPARVYVSARRGAADDFDSALLVSRDGGASFEARPIPGTAGQRLAYIAGVDPTLAERLYLRIDDPEGTRLLETTDSGASFERRFVATGPLPGFAVSADGIVAVGGPDDGIWVGESHALTRRSDARPTCLAFDARGLLYACADSTSARFSLARSKDQGQSFEPVLDLFELCGKSKCSASSDVGALCADDWADIAATLDAMSEAADGEDGDVDLAARCSEGGAGPADGGEIAGAGRSPRPHGGCAFPLQRRGERHAERAARLGWILFAYAAVARSVSKAAAPSIGSTRPRRSRYRT